MMLQEKTRNKGDRNTFLIVSSQVVDKKDNRVSAKLSESLARELEDFAYAQKKATGKRPTYSELIETAWVVFRDSKATEPSSDLGGDLALGDTNRSPNSNGQKGRDFESEADRQPYDFFGIKRECMLSFSAAH
jgi:hypothetical protein